MADRQHTAVPPPAHPTYDLRKVIADALAEDAGDLGDITTFATIPASTQATATFLAKADGVLAGLAVADLVFEAVDPKLVVEWSAKDGHRIKRGQEFGRVQGSARSILVAERVALNFMQRMSGIATATAAMVAAVEGTGTRILETRKTAPGLRLPDKWAVLIGGGANHRMGLFDMMMIKDNHIAAAGGLEAAVAAAEAYITERQLQGVDIEVEASTSEEVQQISALLSAGSAPHVRRVMLDNMAVRDASARAGIDVTLLRASVTALASCGVDTEASGNVTLETVATIAATGVTYVSCGALTHSVMALDISLNIRTQAA